MKQVFEFVLKSQLKECSGHKVNVVMKRSSESFLKSQKETSLMEFGECLEPQLTKYRGILAEQKRGSRFEEQEFRKF